MKVFAAAFLCAISLMPALAQSPVPVASEPRHHVKFENRHTRVFDVVVPRGDETLFHTHSNDYVFVTLVEARLKAEVMGSQPSELILKKGEVRFTEAPITHRVANLGNPTFRCIAVEIIESPGSKAEGTSLANVAGHTLLLENDRIRVWHLVLEPGQSTNMHTHSQSGLGVAISAGSITVETPGGKPQAVMFKPGDFRWHDSGITHSLKNSGKKRFEAVDIEWK